MTLIPAFQPVARPSAARTPRPNSTGETSPREGVTANTRFGAIIPMNLHSVWTYPYIKPFVGDGKARGILGRDVVAALLSAGKRSSANPLHWLSGVGFAIVSQDNKYLPPNVTIDKICGRLAAKFPLQVGSAAEKAHRLKGCQDALNALEASFLVTSAPVGRFRGPATQVYHVTSAGKKYLN